MMLIKILRLFIPMAGEERAVRCGEAGFSLSPRTWSVAPSAGTAGRAHLPSDTDPETPATQV